MEHGTLHSYDHGKCRCVPCKSAKSEYQRKYREGDVYRERKWAKSIETLYGITGDEYNRLLAEQNYGCAICGQPELKGQRLSVDHDHETGEVRGLLCRKHNRFLGLIGDDIASVEAMLVYLRKEHNGEKPGGNSSVSTSGRARGDSFGN